MNLKKTKHANLEKKRGVYFIIGLIVTLSIVLISFEWTTPTEGIADIEKVKDIDFESEMIQITRREEPKPEPKPELPPIIDAILPVDDDIELDDIEFNIEVTKKTKYDYLYVPPDVGEKIEGGEDFFYIVEDMPTFNGGDPNKEFSWYIARNLRYPEIAAENGVSGRVIVQFDIDKTGSLVDAKIFRSIDPALDEEAIRVVLTSPKWTPGKQRNKAVKVRYIFPINFVLQ
ncbi:MAG: energy transducer TonB [Bacteroidales bacterium]|nr:energy transducer TonB [Bacteroidales bacterium]